VKILHIYKDYHPILGGIENHLKLLAEGQAGRGHDVTALVTNPDGLRSTLALENGVRVVRSGRLATVASTPLSIALPWRLLRERPDVVHLHFPYPVGETAQWLLRRGRATVLTYHSDVVKQATILKVYRPVMERVLRHVDAIIVGSPPMRKSAYLAPYQSKLQLIPYGIPLARFSPGSMGGDAAQGPAVPSRGEQPRPTPTTAPAAPDPAFTLLFVGRLRYYKGLDNLIRALPQIPARLRVVGIGPMEAEWRALAQEVGVADRIEWLGETSDDELPAIYHGADLFVLPASHPSEAFGLVQVEAMAAGLPVVCTELGTGTTYVNLDGVTGLVTPPRDPGALATAINALIADPGRRAAMGRAAQDRVAQEFDLEVMVDRVLALYGDLIR
jgi:rhamnosyl/mannosyltransferase